jgi:hypothetical protein
MSISTNGHWRKPGVALMEQVEMRVPVLAVLVGRRALT